MIINTGSGAPKKYIDDKVANLQDQITEEVYTRDSMDNAISKRITNEANQRDAADKAQISRISALETTVSGYGDVVTKNVGTTSGTVPVIGSDNKLPLGIIPEVALSEFAGTADKMEDLADLTAQNGDWAKVINDTDAKNGAYIYNDGTWVKMGNPDITFGAISGDPMSNLNLKAVFDQKLDKTSYFGPTSTSDANHVFTGAGWTAMMGTLEEFDALDDDALKNKPSSAYLAAMLAYRYASTRAYTVCVPDSDGGITEDIELQELTNHSYTLPTGYTKIYTSKINPNEGIYKFFSLDYRAHVVMPSEDCEVMWTEAEAKAVEYFLPNTFNLYGAIYVISKTAMTDCKVRIVSWKTMPTSPKGEDDKGTPLG